MVGIPGTVAYESEHGRQSVIQGGFGGCRRGADSADRIRLRDRAAPGTHNGQRLFVIVNGDDNKAILTTGGTQWGSAECSGRPSGDNAIPGLSNFIVL